MITSQSLGADAQWVHTVYRLRAKLAQDRLRVTLSDYQTLTETGVLHVPLRLARERLRAAEAAFDAAMKQLEQTT